jgi:hypothetical protein
MTLESFAQEKSVIPKAGNCLTILGMAGLPHGQSEDWRPVSALDPMISQDLTNQFTPGLPNLRLGLTLQPHCTDKLEANSVRGTWIFNFTPLFNSSLGPLGFLPLPMR